MIQPNELRIGNWVGAQTKTDCGILFSTERVDEINDIGVRVEGNVGYLSSEITPIPLTPEILERAGLVKHGAVWIHPETMLLEIYNRAKLDGNYHFIGGRMQPDYFLATTKQLRFVHELQNAYALTGTELEIKL